MGGGGGAEGRAAPGTTSSQPSPSGWLTYTPVAVGLWHVVFRQLEGAAVGCKGGSDALLQQWHLGVGGVWGCWMCRYGQACCQPPC